MRTLQINEDVEFQERFWRLERAAWVLGLMVGVAAVLGTFGGGLLGRARVKSGERVVSFERVARLNTPTRVEVASAAEGERLRVFVSAEYAGAMRIEGWEPEPESVVVGEEGWTAVYAAEGAGRVALRVVPVRAGAVRGEIVVNGAGAARVRQFVLP